MPASGRPKPDFYRVIFLSFRPYPFCPNIVQRISILQTEQLIGRNLKYFIKSENAVISRFFSSQQPLADGRLIDPQRIGKFLLAQVPFFHQFFDHIDIRIYAFHSSILCKNKVKRPDILSIFLHWVVTMKRLNIKDGRGLKSRHLFRPPPSLSGRFIFSIAELGNTMRKILQAERRYSFGGKNIPSSCRMYACGRLLSGVRRWKTGKEQDA